MSISFTPAVSVRSLKHGPLGFKKTCLLNRNLTFSHAIEDHVNQDVSPSPTCTVAMETKQHRLEQESCFIDPTS